MKRYAVIEKKVGETPLSALSAWQAAHSEYAGVPLSYAGRLDPMASGKLLILIGSECKRQKSYTGLDKEYEIEVLLDFGSDTGDALGVVEYGGGETRMGGEALAKVLKGEQGTHERAYPIYSSKTVDGKPLFLHSLEGTLADISVPTHEEHIYEIKVVGSSVISSEELSARITAYLSLVPRTTEPSKALGADFRIEKVRAGWSGALSECPGKRFALIRLRVACGSGTYMRSLAGRIGKSLGTNALALSIHRTKIGRRWHGLWLGSY